MLVSAAGGDGGEEEGHDGVVGAGAGEDRLGGAPIGAAGDDGGSEGDVQRAGGGQREHQSMAMEIMAARCGQHPVNS